MGDDAAEARARAAREAIELANGLIKEARILGQQGYTRADSRTRRVIDQLQQAGHPTAADVLEDIAGPRPA